MTTEESRGLHYCGAELKAADLVVTFGGKQYPFRGCRCGNGHEVIPAGEVDRLEKAIDSEAADA